MPAVSAPAKVLVSGANGYIAVWVVQTLLKKGYSVRGTVRTADKGKHLQELFGKFGDKFEFVVVEDITKEGAFDEAVKDVDAIEHTASPFHFRFKEPDELLIPAVKGTVGMLESAKKYGKSVKRIVVTASCASVLQSGYKPPIKFDESSWNEPAIKDVQENGNKAHPGNVYRASKTMAEKAAWEFYEKNKSEISWDLSVLNPPFVFGPPIHEVSSLTSLNTSMQQLYDAIVLGKLSDEALSSMSNCWIDVRDLAEAHVLAVEKEAAGGERMIVSAGCYWWQDFVNIATSLTPPILPNLPTGNPDLIKGKAYELSYDVSKAERILGIKYRGAEEMVRDCLVDFAERGGVGA